MTKSDYILFDLIDEEELEWVPSGTNNDVADDTICICPYCLTPNHQHKKDCPGIN